MHATLASLFTFLLLLARPGRAQEPSIAVIGGGFAGLAAAHRLLERNFTNFRIFEALDRVGGRVHAVPYNNGYLQMAAQFINGNRNPLYAIAEKLGVVRTTYPDFGHFADAVFRYGDCPVPEADVSLFRSFVAPLEDAYNEVAFTDEQRSYDETVKTMFDRDYARFLSEQNATSGFRRNVFDALTRPYQAYFECEYGAKWEELSLRAISDWDDLGQLGESYTTSEIGYTAIVDFMKEMIPTENIVYNHRIANIDYSGNRTKLTLVNGSVVEQEFDRVIVTAALGHLKRFADRLFTPPLSPRKLDAIDKIAMGANAKVFLEFNITWPDQYLIPLAVSGCHGRHIVDELEAEITTFERVPWAHNVLIAWIGGHGPEKIDAVSDARLSDVVTRILRNAYGSSSIPEPTAIYRMKWTQEDLFGGSYSYVSFAQAQARIRHVDLSLPVKRNGVVRVQFAGEATHHRIFQTAVGAYLSGRREADRALELNS